MSSARASRRLLVVSHHCVVPVNQAVYARLGALGWDVHIVVPARWRHEYAPEPFEPLPLEGLEDRLVPLRVVLPGRPQRHLYLSRPSRVVRSLRPAVAFVEEEGFSVPAFQWGRAFVHAGVPFGVQADENLDRPLPWIARWIRRRVLGTAAFVAARSPKAGDQARSWGATGRIALVPHAVPGWECRPRPDRNGTFTVGFAGRLTPEKGVEDLVSAAGMLDGRTRLLLVGDGPLRGALESAATPSCTIEVRTGVGHGEMPDAYAEMDVLVLPSRTTERWAEQFGRVLVEALSCGVPVVGSDSGEIPWVIGETRGGKIYAEGDTGALAGVLEELRDNSSERRMLARAGREAVQKLFSADAAAHALDSVLTEVADGH